MVGEWLTLSCRPWLQLIRSRGDLDPYVPVCRKGSIPCLRRGATLRCARLIALVMLGWNDRNSVSLVSTRGGVRSSVRRVSRVGEGR